MFDTKMLLWRDNSCSFIGVAQTFFNRASNWISVYRLYWVSVFSRLCSINQETQTLIWISQALYGSRRFHKQDLSVVIPQQKLCAMFPQTGGYENRVLGPLILNTEWWRWGIHTPSFTQSLCQQRDARQAVWRELTFTFTAEGFWS